MRLELDQLTLRFGGHTVLDALCANIADMRCLALMGPSGGGKSTLLRVIGGLLRPGSGEVRLDGVAVPTNPAGLIRHRRQLGTVFQSYNLFLHLTALKNILLPLVKVHGMTETDARKKALDLLERFQLAEHAHKRPRELSGGQQQRIALVRAVAIQPKLVLLDEPTSALDPEMTTEVLNLIVELRDGGLPLILVTHQMRFARRIADHVLFLEENQPLVHAPADSFFQSPPTPTAKRYVEEMMEL